MLPRNVAFASSAERESKYRETEAKFGKCKHCHKFHTYERQVGSETMTWPSCRLSSCPDFEILNPEEKGKVVKP